MQDIELIFDNEKQLYYTNTSILKGLLMLNNINIKNNFRTNTSYKQNNININNDNQSMKDVAVGKFKSNNGKYNISNACDWLIKNSKASTQHECATYVRLAIEAGFNDPNSTSGRPKWAWKYINYLPSIGFKFIDKVDKLYNGDKGKYSPLVGDIAVYMKGNNEYVPGHICMYTGNQWMSDFKQKNMIVYQSTPKAYIFRYQS